MPTVPISNLTLKILTGVFIYLVFQLNFFSVWQAGFGWKVALTDAGINLLLQLLTARVIRNIFRFYQPKVSQFWAVIGACAIFAILLVIGAKFLLVLAVPGNAGYAGFVDRSTGIRIGFSILLFCCLVILNLIWNMLRRERENNDRRHETERLSREAELFKLRQQLQPHFLFNSLNSISSMVVSEPKEARKMIEQLSTFLRTTINRKDGEMVTLSEELEQVERYLTIEKLRFGHRLQTLIVAADDCRENRLPPLLLQPVVENAIKFGLYDTLGEVLISIRATCIDNELLITVNNPFDPDTSSRKKGTGFGLSGLQRRLYLLFGRQDLLDTETSNNQFITSIRIPQAYVQGNTDR